ncbi:MAG: aldo/keto reductase [Betaproteobacteria bacterium]|nr:MAG: aldo/keto reductase [Betaproteobacteria bacterium]
MDRRRRALLAAVAAAAINPALAQRGPLLKKIPASGEAIPVIGLGTWQSFDVGADAAARKPLREVLQGFVQAGGRVVDSSPMYGAAESMVGDLVAELGIRDKLFIATKVWTSGRAEGLRQMENSFKRLRVERMDLMQVHNLVDVETHTRTLQEMKRQQKLRYIGITHYGASAHAEVERWLKTGHYDFVQINYSLGEPQAERRLLPLALEKKIAVIANRPFAEGALLRRVKGKPLPPWAAELGIASWAQYFLKWIVSHPAVTCAIPGTGNPKHMADNLAASTGALPDEAARKRMADYFQSS